MKTNSFERFSLHQSDAYIVDYTHQTKHTPVKRGVELHKAFGQLMSTFNYLTDRQVISRLHKTYLIISLPLQSNAPFEHFVFSPNQLSEMRKRYKVIVRGVNKVSIISASKLKV